MRRLILLTALLLAIAVAASVEAQEPVGQTPLTSMTVGGLFENGSNTHFIVKGDVRLNLRRWVDEQQQVRVQTYLRAGFLRSNDISLNPNVSQKLQGIELIPMIEYHISEFFIGFGVGRAMEFEDTATVEVPAYAGVLGWQPSNVMRLFAGCDYYSRTKYFSNIVAVYGGIALSLEDLVPQ